MCPTSARPLTLRRGPARSEACLPVDSAPSRRLEARGISPGQARSWLGSPSDRKRGQSRDVALESAKSRVVKTDGERSKRSRASPHNLSNFRWLTTLVNSPSRAYGWGLEFLHFREFCRVAYKKKGNRQNSLFPAPGKHSDP